MEKGTVIKTLQGKSGTIRIIAPETTVSTTEDKREDIYTFLAKLIIRDKQLSMRTK